MDHFYSSIHSINVHVFFEKRVFLNVLPKSLRNSILLNARIMLVNLLKLTLLKANK